MGSRKLGGFAVDKWCLEQAGEGVARYDELEL